MKQKNENPTEMKTLMQLLDENGIVYLDASRPGRGEQIYVLRHFAAEDDLLDQAISVICSAFSYGHEYGSLEVWDKDTAGDVRPGLKAQQALSYIQKRLLKIPPDPAEFASIN